MTLASGTDIGIFGALDNQYASATNAALLDTLNATTPSWALSFTGSGSSDIIAEFEGVLPSTYGGEALDVLVYLTNAGTTNAVLFSAELERRNANVDLSTDHWGTLTDAAAATTVPGTANQEFTQTIATVSLPSGFTAGDLYRLRLKRRKSQAGDNNTSATLVHAVRVAVH